MFTKCRRSGAARAAIARQQRTATAPSEFFRELRERFLRKLADIKFCTSRLPATHLDKGTGAGGGWWVWMIVRFVCNV